jgi:acyl phosphate:glycerol-3-phosphate acyltransferase
MLDPGSKILLSYLIGSVMGSMVMGYLRGGVDIRTMGSGNAGSTNALRTQGWLFATGVIVIDVGKGILAAAVIPGLSLPFSGADALITPQWLTFAVSAAAVVGHVWPVWHKFKGGKGAATLLGTLIVLSPEIVLPIILIWAWTLVLFGYVGLATMATAVAAPLYLGLTRLPHDQALFYYCVAMALYMIYSHRANIIRMFNGTEPKNTRLMIFQRSGRNSGDGKD